MRKLSHSACTRYMACPASYDYYYNQGIRPAKLGSALMFGSAMDSALNELLLTKSMTKALDAYNATVTSYALGSVTIGKYDYDSDLLTEKDREQLLTALVEVGYKGNDIDGLVASLMSKHQLSENQYKALDLVVRRVFEHKATLLLTAYADKVLPYIQQVYNVQKPSGPGYLDATVEWKGYGKIIVDHKTSGRPYADDSIEYSAQLAMYAAEEKVNQVAFVVLVKQLKKNKEKVCGVCGHKGAGSHKTCDNVVDGDRCGGPWEITIRPEAEIQILHGEVTKEAMAVADELQREVRRAVEAKIFPCNVGSCNSQYGRACEYKNLKWKNSMDGLIKVERTKK